MLSLRDLLTGAVPGNSLNQIGLGDASDPQFNRFTYNISGSLGPSPGVNTGMPTISAGPYSNGAPGAAPQPKQQGATINMPFSGSNMNMVRESTTPAYMGDYSPTHMLQGMPSYMGANNSPQTFSPLGYQTYTPWTGGGNPLKSAMTNWKGPMG